MVIFHDERAFDYKVVARVVEQLDTASSSPGKVLVKLVATH